ncbi:MAG: hypothetical protein JWM10_2794 [Myxococcaceae bacterium]|nr:hypothetical protein [Myxococcaceae bacterium]
MTTTTPYRAPAEEEVRVAPPRLVVAWNDAEQDSRWKIYLRGYYALLLVLGLLGAVALASPPLAAVMAVALVVYWLVRRKQKVAPGFTLDVADGVLAITRAGSDAAEVVRLSEVRDVEVERKSIQRVSFHQNAFDAVPTTQLSGDLDVGRIVVVYEGDRPRARLTEEYAAGFVCMERFGKVRSFLRKHGWKPVGERGGP